MALIQEEQATGACVKQLPEPMRQAWIGFLRAHGAITKALDADLTASTGLTLSAFEVLTRVAATDAGRLRISDLASQALLSQSRVSRLVDALEADGLLERRACPDDSRVVHATITARGRELAVRAMGVHLAAIEERFFAPLGEDGVEELARAWDRVLPAACARRASG